MSIVWAIIAIAAFSYSVYRFIKWRKDDKIAQNEFERKIKAEKDRNRRD